MPVQFFGQYLISKSIVTPKQLIEALSYQEYQTLKIGHYAVEDNYLTPAQAKQINIEQQKRNLKFGETAVAMGLLTQAQVDELLTIQRNNHVYLGEAVIAKGFASKEIIEDALKRFVQEQQRFDVDITQLEQIGIDQPETIATFLDLTKKLFFRMWDVHVKIEQPQVKLGAVTLEGSVVRISLTGQFNTDLILSVSQEMMIKGVENTIGEVNPNQEICEDLLKEIANVVSGNMIAILAKQGKSCDVQPPLIIDNEIHLDSSKNIYATLISPEGNGAVIFDPLEF
jgi:CheY-specific phosphatase CheX